MIASALPDIRIIPCGDAALTLLCAEEISLDAFQTVQRLRALLEHPPLPAVREIVPAFTSLTLLLDIPALAAISAEPLASFLSCLFDRLAAQNLDSPALLKHDDTVVNIPICYNEEYAPDIREMALRKGLSVAEIIKLHTEAEYQVAMIGFTPGFPYLLGLPPELAMPRKDTPRARVNAGAVGIAGAQTGIYPLESPGGWNIIGQTPLTLFSLEKALRNEAPTLVRTGDRVRFYAVPSFVEEAVLSKRASGNEEADENLRQTRATAAFLRITAVGRKEFSTVFRIDNTALTRVCRPCSPRLLVEDLDSINGSSIFHRTILRSAGYEVLLLSLHTNCINASICHNTSTIFLIPSWARANKHSSRNWKQNSKKKPKKNFLPVERVGGICGVYASVLSPQRHFL
jgi:inhibitor of KinA